MKAKRPWYLASFPCKGTRSPGSFLRPVTSDGAAALRRPYFSGANLPISLLA